MTTTPVGLVIFDCDGVLVDSERLAVKVDVEIIGKLGWAITEAEVIERFVGRSNEFMRQEIQKAIGRALGPDWDRAYDELYRAAFERDLVAVDGIVLALDAITAATCVASSGSHEKMKFTLGRTGLWDRFAGRIFSASEVKSGKPAPDLFLHAALRMGVAPAECAVVEDSRFGIAAARAAGMRAFGYAGGLTPASWLEGPGTVVFRDMRELPRLLAT